MSDILFGSTLVTCTPHFKSDVENPWVTRESKILLHYWFDPDKTKTLLQVAENIEAWAVGDYQVQVQQTNICCPPRFHLYISYVEIRGRTYGRQEMATLSTSRALYDNEPFNMRVYGSTSCTIL